MTTAVITDITRMEGPYICVAAIDSASGLQIRLNSPRPTDSISKDLDIGVEINLDWNLSKDNFPPHVEDGRWEQQSLRITGRLSEEEFLDLLINSAVKRVSNLFGDPSRRGRNRNIGYEPGVGRHSLGTLLVDAINIREQDNGLRVLFKDADGDYVVPFQDLHVRLHKQQCPQCSRNWVKQAGLVYENHAVLLRLGLARPYERPGYYPPTCWLQVNHIIPLEASSPDHFRLP